MKTTYVNRWGYTISATPSLPGVWRRKEGGFLVRGRATDPRTKKQHEVMRALDGDDPAAAYQHLQGLLRTVRNPTVAETPSKVLFADYAVSLLARKIQRGDIKSAKTRRLWGDALEKHLIPAFGNLHVAELRRADIQRWLDESAGTMRRPTEARVLVPNGQPRRRSKVVRVAPRTINLRLSILRVIVNAIVEEFDLDKSPMRGIHPLDQSDHPTYTDEEPNSLTVDEARRFLAMMRELYPQHFAMTALGFATGLRPSTMRPLRRSGAQKDVLWEDHVLLVRRSQTVGDEVMNTTKTHRRQRIALPTDLVTILQWHVDTLPDEGPMAESDLLFPSETGGFRAPSALDKPFAAVWKAMGLRKRVTPRAMRRTFQDLARAASVTDLVTRSISGHATEEMQHHYSTVGETEQRDGLARVITLAGFREAARIKAPEDQVVGKVVGKSP
jgi:site-specific recombinase XerC